MGDEVLFEAECAGGEEDVQVDMEELSRNEE